MELLQKLKNKMVGEDGVEPPITREDVVKRLKRGKLIKIVAVKNGKEVLWGGRRLSDLINRVIEAAAKGGGVWLALY